MKIYIPSRGRPQSQPVAEALQQAGIEFHIVKTTSDESDYSKYPFISFPSKHIGEKRQFILEFHKEFFPEDPKLLMLDDDLTFRVRTVENKFIRAGKDELQDIIETIDSALDEYAHVGITDEFMSNLAPRGYKKSGRYNQVLGYNLSLFPKQPIPKFRLMINEEHDMNLQLQEVGLPPCILTEYTKSSKFYATGGLAHVRTAENEKEEHQKFAALWPQLVSIKDTKNSLSGLRVQVKWKKALRKTNEDNHSNISENRNTSNVQATS